MKRFPFGLTAAALIAFTVLVGLGVWQVRRLAWKRDLLSKIEALQHAQARPIDAVVVPTARPADLAFRRVRADCASASPAPVVYRYAVHDGAVAWRLLSACRLSRGAYDGIMLDRGVVTRFGGLMAPVRAAFPAPVAVTGVLRAPGPKPMLDAEGVAAPSEVTVVRIVDDAALAKMAKAAGLAHPVPYLLAVESERPPPAGIVPVALPPDIPNNHFIYALTWFAFAGILACFYGALVRRRMRTT